MYVLMRGTALSHGKAVMQGSVWGDDILLNDKGLQLQSSAFAITYLWVYTLDARALTQSIMQFPLAREAIERIRYRWLLRRSLVRLAELIVWSNGRSFFGRLQPLYALRRNEQGRHEWWTAPLAAGKFALAACC